MGQCVRGDTMKRLVFLLSARAGDQHDRGVRPSNAVVRHTLLPSLLPRGVSLDYSVALEMNALREVMVMVRLGTSVSTHQIAREPLLVSLRRILTGLVSVEFPFGGEGLDGVVLRRLSLDPELIQD